MPIATYERQRALLVTLVKALALLATLLLLALVYLLVRLCRLEARRRDARAFSRLRDEDGDGDGDGDDKSEGRGGGGGGVGDESWPRSVDDVRRSLQLLEEERQALEMKKGQMLVEAEWPREAERRRSAAKVEELTAELEAAREAKRRAEAEAEALAQWKSPARGDVAIPAATLSMAVTGLVGASAAGVEESEEAQAEQAALLSEAQGILSELIEERMALQEARDEFLETTGREMGADEVAAAAAYSGLPHGDGGTTGEQELLEEVVQRTEKVRELQSALVQQLVTPARVSIGSTGGRHSLASRASLILGNGVGGVGGVGGVAGGDVGGDGGVGGVAGGGVAPDVVRMPSLDAMLGNSDDDGSSEDAEGPSMEDGCSIDLRSEGADSTPGYERFVPPLPRDDDGAPSTPPPPRRA